MEKSLTESYKELVKPGLAGLLEILKLNVSYQSGQGDSLQATFPDGSTRPVFDFLGGYGSTILGHNPEFIQQEIRRFLDQKKVIHAQASIRSSTAKLSEKLNDLLNSHTSEKRKFYLTAANSGAEAVEAALKHALLEWNHKRDALLHRMKTQVLRGKIAEPGAIEKKILLLQEASPTLLAIKGSFHGKTAAAIHATENSEYKKMFPKFSFNVEFLSANLNEVEIQKSLDQFEFVFSEHVKFSLFFGFIFEPIQGEGGVKVMPHAPLKNLTEKLRKQDVPIIADEIQSGLWRTGKFLALPKDVHADYFIFGKSLGASYAKVSAVLISESHYQQEFSLLHTSTFAEDDYSSELATAALEYLGRNEGDIAIRAGHFKAEIHTLVKTLIGKYPKVIKELRGEGFFLGLEFNFNDQTNHPDLLLGFAEQGHLSYLLTSYLLHHHGLRVGVTLSSSLTLRLEPSAFISDEAIAQLKMGLTDLCQTLSERKVLKLLAHLWPLKADADLNLISNYSRPKQVADTGVIPVGFVTHMIDGQEAQKMDLALESLDPKDLQKFYDTYCEQASPFRFHQQVLESSSGQKVQLNLYGLMIPSKWFEEQVRMGSYLGNEIVQKVVDLSAAHGMKYLGLGQFTSIVSENGLLLNSPADLILTTGNSLTAGMAIKALRQCAAERNLPLKVAKVGIVGFLGNICQVITQIIAPECGSLTLIHRESLEESSKFRSAAESLKTDGSNGAMKFSHDPADLKDCDYVIVGTNSTQIFLGNEHFKDEAVILDISVPSNVKDEVRTRKTGAYFVGGLAQLPNSQMISHPWYFLKNTPDVYACLAETILMGMTQPTKSLSLGKLSKDGVLKSLELAEKNGLTLSRPRNF